MSTNRPKMWRKLLNPMTKTFQNVSGSRALDSGLCVMGQAQALAGLILYVAFMEKICYSHYTVPLLAQVYSINGYR